MPSHRPIHVEVGDRVRVANDGLVHVVGWTNHRSWDAVCENIIEDYQPDYYQGLLEAHEPMPKDDPALLLQRASDDVPTTCVLCLARQFSYRPPDQRDVFDDVDE
jgi:hypothetical protein